MTARSPFTIMGRSINAGILSWLRPFIISPIVFFLQIFLCIDGIKVLFVLD